MEMVNTYPTNLRGSRRHRAELAVYQAFSDSLIDGLAAYGAVPPGGFQVDIAAWYPGHVRTAIEVKGGQYVYINGVWQRISDLGGELVSDQLAQAFRAGIRMHRYLKQHQGEHTPFVVSVLVLPDLPAGHEIERLNSQTMVLCGMDGLVERIRNQAVERNEIHFPPTWADARREWHCCWRGRRNLSRNPSPSRRWNRPAARTRRA